MGVGRLAGSIKGYTKGTKDTGDPAKCAFCAFLWLPLEWWQSLSGGLFFFEAKGPVGLHQRVNVACAFVDDCSLAVAQIALDRIVV